MKRLKNYLFGFILVTSGLLILGSGETATQETTEDIVVIKEEVEVKEFDGADFIDYTENYKDQVFEWKFTIVHDIFAPKSLRDFLGKEIKLTVGNQVGAKFPNTNYMYILIPEGLKVPKVDYSDDVMIKFKCGGDLNSGNIALSVSRP